MPLCPSCDFDNQGDSNYCSKCGFEIYSATGRITPDTLLEDRYLIVETIGKGGMGAVYKALDMRLESTPVALKEMSTSALGQGKLTEAIEAFKKEASMLIKLRHPALPRITDYFSNGEDRWYIVMDFIEGEMLEATAKKRGAIPESELINWAKQLCGVLDYLHNQDPPVIFRDLKPANIMLTPNNEIKLIDFGIARHFKPGTSTDTSHYASLGFSPPEQYGEGQTDPRSDIYSLGATLHYLLTGIDPGKNPFSFELPSEKGFGTFTFNKAIMKALEMKVEQRPKSVRAFLKILNEVGEQISSATEALNHSENSFVAGGISTDSHTVAIDSLPSKVLTSKEKAIRVLSVFVAVIVLLSAVLGVYYYYPVTDLILNHERLELKVGIEELLLVVSQKPSFAREKPLIWESSNPEILEISKEGVIKALDKGMSIITVKIEDNSLSATCTVWVIYPTITWNDGSYTGQLANDIPEGFGEWINSTGESYSGHWANGIFHGEGTNILSDGQIFAGEFVDGLLEGEGSWSNADGDSYIGEFEKGVKHGEGVFTWADGSEYTGELIEGLKHGLGMLISADGKKTEGEWKDDEYVVRQAAKQVDVSIFHEPSNIDLLRLEVLNSYNIHHGDRYIDVYVNHSHTMRIHPASRDWVELPVGGYHVKIIDWEKNVRYNETVNLVDRGFSIRVAP